MGQVDLQIFFSQTQNGPGKVILNLTKGLDLCKINYELNQAPKDGINKICLSEHSILKTHFIKELYIGPNICTLPIDSKIVMEAKYKKYLVNSKWTYSAYKKWLPDNKLDMWAVGVDTDLFSNFSEEKKTNDCLIYFKRRNLEDLIFATKMLKKLNQSFEIIEYGNYNEEHFLNSIKKSKYAFVIDNCESQGIAIQEMMSSNLPLFVWDVEFWDDRGEEYKVPASSVPYWDNRCGLKIFYKNEIFDKFYFFINNLNLYSPRDYILEEFQLDKKALEIIEKLNR